uniref:Conserved oligomeric Golgi complex subunit 4 n=1 Tax=Rhizochromulina marina TaxID=1034831 RepID=A0A7S2WIB6_9STRA|mmetsp:Transcript_25516/g.74403  ORF Transcript_25516/g.74403 Transcript_25516/m.74403 type:complete len:801 (+) Transcript_25516:105-2507(+)
MTLQSSIVTLRNQLAALDAEAKESDGRIQALLEAESILQGSGDQRGPSVSTLLQEKLEPRNFNIIAGEAAMLAEQIEESRVLSERVSRTIRRLDRAQMNVQHALALVEDIVNLKDCAQGVITALKEEDLRDATGYVRQFHDIDSVAARASADYDRIIQAEKELQTQVLQRFEEATAKADSGEVAKYVALLGPLGLAETGLQSYLAFAKREVQRIVAAGPPAQGGGDPTDGQLPALFNAAHVFLEAHMRVASAALSQADGGAELLRLVHQDIEGAAVQCIRRFLSDIRRQLVKLPAVPVAVSALSASPFKKEKRAAPFNVDAFTQQLEDMIIVVQQVESYTRYVRNLCRELEAQGQREAAVLPSVTALDGVVTELGGDLSNAEMGLLGVGIRKAIDMDNTAQVAADFSRSSNGDAPTSSAVEDPFLVAGNALNRSLATGNCTVASAVINHVNNSLAEDLFDALKTKGQAAANRLGGEGGVASLLTHTGAQQYLKVMQDNMKKAGVAGPSSSSSSSDTAAGRGRDGRGGTAEDAKTGDASMSAAGAKNRTLLEAMVTFNNLEAAAAYTQRLRENILKDILNDFEEGPEMPQLLAVVQGLQSTAGRYLEARDDALATVATQLKPRIRSLVSDLVSEKSGAQFLLDDASFEQASTSPTNWALRMVEALEQDLLAPFVQTSSPLSGSNCRVLLTHVAVYLANRIEHALRRLKFTLLGGLQLDRDLRSVISWLAGHAGREVRDVFVRLSQFVLLLQIDSPRDAVEYYGANVAGGSWQLSAGQVREILALRTEANFGPDDIARLPLS